VFRESFGFHPDRGLTGVRFRPDASFGAKAVIGPGLLWISPAETTRLLKRATSDQIGRILGDWLRMRAANVRARDPVMSPQLLAAANRALERAYRQDNGLPPDADPSPPSKEQRAPPRCDSFRATRGSCTRRPV